MEQKLPLSHAECAIDASRVKRRVLRFHAVRFAVPSANAAAVIALLFFVTGGGGIFIAGAGSLALLAIACGILAHFDDPRRAYRLFMPMAPLIEVAESGNAPFGAIALEWSRRCRACGIEKSMTFANPLLDTLFASMRWGSPPTAALFLPCATAVERFTADELEAIIEHEVAHLKLSGPFFRAAAELLCFLPDLLLRGICAVRIACMRRGWRGAARNVHRLERTAFLATYRFVSRTEEYAADALSAEALRSPRAMISALETFRAFIDEPPGDEDDLGRLLRALERVLERRGPASPPCDEFDRDLMRHPTFEERRRALLGLCR